MEVKMLPHKKLELDAALKDFMEKHKPQPKRVLTPPDLEHPNSP
jgi:hypothetical protein